MSFRTIHTTAALAALAAAEAAGSQITLSHMAIGDGGGFPADPSTGQATLVHEVYRTTINRVFQDPTNPAVFTAEMIIPAGVGGWTIREACILDASGGLFAVANIPETYKPADGEGAFSDVALRLVFAVDNASLVTLIVDPNVAVATQKWVLDNVAELPPGGTTGQVLMKKSNVDQDADWEALSSLKVTVSTIEEDQVMTAAQTQVDLTTVTTYGLAVYLDGKRLEKTDWTAHPTILTRFTLATAATAGQKLFAVQNEPAGDAGQPLLQEQNFADVKDKTLARANLGVYSQAETDQKAPSGAVMYYGGSFAPAGWLKANGAAISRTAYAALFAAIGTVYGAGDGNTTFNVPDLRGEFIRGADDGRGVDASRAIGSWQGDQTKAHNHSGATVAVGDHQHAGTTTAVADHAHSGSTSTVGDHSHANGIFTRLLRPPYVGSLTGTDTGGSGTEQAIGGPDSGNILPAGGHGHSFTTNSAGGHSHSFTTNPAGGHSHGFTTDSTGGNEARPRNVALLACIKI